MELIKNNSLVIASLIFSPPMTRLKYIQETWYFFAEISTGLGGIIWLPPRAKDRLFLFLFSILFCITVNAQSVSGGSGICHVGHNPKLVDSLRVQDHRFECLVAFDTTTNIIYNYRFNSPDPATPWVAQSVDNPVTAYVTDIIWAEENGAINNNSRQYSFGNGAIGTTNFGIPIWEDMEVVGLVLNAELTGTSLTAGYTVNAVTQPAPYQILATENTNVYDFPTAQPLLKGDLINFISITEVGNWSDVRIGLIIKKRVYFE